MRSSLVENFWLGVIVGAISVTFLQAIVLTLWLRFRGPVLVKLSDPTNRGVE